MSYSESEEVIEFDESYDIYDIDSSESDESKYNFFPYLEKYNEEDSSKSGEESSY